MLDHDRLKACARAWSEVTVPIGELRVLVWVVARTSIALSQAARHLGMQRSDITTRVRRLTDRGLLCVLQDQVDRRVHNLEPTPEGIALVTRLLMGDPDSVEEPTVDDGENRPRRGWCGPIPPVEAGHRGGLSTSAKHGRAHYKQMGIKGGQANLERHGHEHFVAMGRKGAQKKRELRDQEVLAEN